MLPDNGIDITLFHLELSHPIFYSKALRASEDTIRDISLVPNRKSGTPN